MIFSVERLLLVLFTLILCKCLCRINFANVADPIDSYKRDRRKENIKRKIKFENTYLKSVMINSTLAGDGNFSRMNEDSISDRKMDYMLAKMEYISVADASIKHGLPSVIEKCKNPGDLALTFDDGVSKITQAVLDILKRENVRATFFILGNTLDSPILGEEYVRNILNVMLKNGHTIGSHSYSHPNFDEYWPEGIQHEMDKAKQLFRKLVGKAPRFMRPPFGNVTTRTLKALHDLGYFIIKWNVDTNDWMHVDAPEKSFLDFRNKLPDENKINEIRWQKHGLTDLGVKTIINGVLGSKIALMHDIHIGIVEFLPQLIKHTKSLGYKLVSMEECLGGIDPYFDE